MVWASINSKLRHLIKIFMSYISIEIKLNKTLLTMAVFFLLLLNLNLGLFI